LLATDSLFFFFLLVLISDIITHKPSELLEVLDNELERPLSDNIVMFYEAMLTQDKTKKPVLLTDDDKTKALNKSQQKLYKVLSTGYTLHFPSLNNLELARWIEEKLEAVNLKITKGASQALVALVGSDLWLMNNELEKIIAYKHGQGTSLEVDLNDIKLLINHDLSQPIFDLTDAISNRDRARAVKILSDQISQNVPDLYLLSMLARQFKILLTVRQALDNGLSGRALADHLKLNSYVLQKSINQARNFNLPVLQSIINTLVKIDYRYKTGNLPIETMIDVLIARI